MQIHTLQIGHLRHSGRRIGRGGKRGTYSGRGIKGQHARAGAKFRPAERELLKKIPKLRGYRFKSFQKRAMVVTLADLEKRYKEGETVDPKSLLARKLVRRIQGKLPPVKIVAKGTLKKKLIFKDVAMSAKAVQSCQPQVPAKK